MLFNIILTFSKLIFKLISKLSSFHCWRSKSINECQPVDWPTGEWKLPPHNKHVTIAVSGTTRMTLTNVLNDLLRQVQLPADLLPFGRKN